MRLMLLLSGAAAAANRQRATQQRSEWEQPRVRIHPLASASGETFACFSLLPSLSHVGFRRLPVIYNTCSKGGPLLLLRPINEGTVALHAFGPAQPLNIPCRRALTAGV